MKKRVKMSKAKVTISVIVGVFVVLIVASYLSQQRPAQEVPPADQYFRVLGSTVDDADFPRLPDTSVLLLRGVSFNLTAFAGDAHEVFLESTGLSDAQYLGTIEKDEVRFISLQFPQGYMVTEKESGYPVEIRIRSTEARGAITFYLVYE